mmetsp:Transcript_41902/g.94665  ORF Transcript_41902/g.94665 Transcript_41902/m.94665 type:complete len:211 (+) Transcript_41902:1865-2497(+)
MRELHGRPRRPGRPHGVQHRERGLELVDQLLERPPQGVERRRELERRRFGASDAGARAGGLRVLLAGGGVFELRVGVVRHVGGAKGVPALPRAHGRGGAEGTHELLRHHAARAHREPLQQGRVHLGRAAAVDPLLVALHRPGLRRRPRHRGLCRALVPRRLRPHGLRLLPDHEPVHPHVAGAAAARVGDAQPRLLPLRRDPRGREHHSGL